MTATLSQIDQLIEAARRQLDGLVALRSSVASESEPEPAPDVTDDDFAPYNLIDTGTAAQRAKVSKSTIRKWVNDDGIGFKRGGRLRVSIPRLRRHTGDDAL
ncbi:helix-turn-helix domain-containing protein [Rhizobium leguminosarum]|uniref:helix-turn-helix domain-containing protein n=1 Tax=Rhizobium leguminosarum TaxID=384 RepID=UPI00140FBDD7|nr:helix-turn-helix domain-containing protein [Rhizobium leguminosarum]QIO58872.1 helix-turn-helix domain-containing protein [Rhizobium leguminosarum bv. trifolii]